METWFYVVESIEGDYANLKRTDIDSNEYIINCLLIV